MPDGDCPSQVTVIPVPVSPLRRCETSLEDCGRVLPRARLTVDPRGCGSAEAKSPFVFAIVHRALRQFCDLWLFTAAVAVALVLRSATRNDLSSTLRVL